MSSRNLDDQVAASLGTGSIREGIGIAIESLRSNRVRAALTILGIVIGVATVMAMAAMIVGVRSSVTGELAALGPNNFMVDRFDQTEVQLINDGTQRPPWEGKPPITPREAELIAGLPSVESVTASVSTQAELRYEATVISSIDVRGLGHLWPDYTRGDFVYGRNFMPAEEQAGAQVVVLSEVASDALFNGRNPVGRFVRLRGERFQVIGVFRQPDNIFSGMASNWVTVPASTAVQRLRANPNWYSLLVVPNARYTQAEAIDQVTAGIRASRGLRPIEDNNFAVVRQEALTEMFDQLTGVFFLVMLVLSSIGLMVGGVGVVAIMMISVTERTREIGVRKALGATRREILWQFLVESMTVTVIGGAIGVLVGSGGALLLGFLTPVPASVPLWSVAAALGVSAVAGIGFGLYPANRAARLDPVEALRYE
ncbi:MAG: FtsX-like permease family protein [Gemmatimonas sp.]|nr:FtsX-like permease family protein [Gemmatimonas sp.]